MTLKTFFLLIVLVFGLYPVSGQTFTLKHDHSNILVSNLELSALFYKKILKLKELETPWGENPNIRFFSIGNNAQIHMCKVDKEDIVINKIRHIAFTISEFDAYLNFLKKEGIEYFNFSGDRFEIQLRPDGVKQIYFQDPDGNWIEINDANY